MLGTARCVGGAGCGRIKPASRLRLARWRTYFEGGDRGLELLGSQAVASGEVQPSGGELDVAFALPVRQGRTGWRRWRP